MPDWGRAYTPAEGRALSQEIRRLSREKGIREDTLAAIAQALGARLGSTRFDELIRLVSDKATEAAELQAELDGLKRQVARYEEESLRSEAQRYLQAAQDALDAGDFAIADGQLAQLVELRRRVRARTAGAWEGAVKAQAAAASLGLNHDRATNLYLEAAGEEERLARATRWRLILSAAKAQNDGAQLGARDGKFQRAFALSQEALILLDPGVGPDWLETQVELAEAELGLGIEALDPSLMRSALGRLRTVRDNSPDAWSRFHADLSLVSAILEAADYGTDVSVLTEADELLQSLIVRGVALELEVREKRRLVNMRGLILRHRGESRRSIEDLDLAIALFQSLRLPNDEQLTESHAGLSSGNLADALFARLRLEETEGRLEEAIAVYGQAISAYSEVGSWGNLAENRIPQWTLRVRRANRRNDRTAYEAVVAEMREHPLNAEFLPIGDRRYLSDFGQALREVRNERGW